MNDLKFCVSFFSNHRSTANCNKKNGEMWRDYHHVVGIYTIKIVAAFLQGMLKNPRSAPERTRFFIRARLQKLKS